MNWSVDQAMDALKISEEDKEEIRKKYILDNILQGSRANLVLLLIC